MSRIIVGGYCVGMVQTNCYYVHLEGSGKTLVFDPGDAGRQIAEALEQQGLEIAAVFLTHAHYDHIFGVEEIRKKSGAPVYASAAEARLCGDPQLNLSADFGRPCTVKADEWLRDNQTMDLAGMKVRMIDTPGHTEGSCCYYITAGEDQHILISGDTLFEQSVGRTDLPTGSMSALVRSVKDKLFVLPDDTEVYPGHGGATSIGFEKLNNYYVHS